MALRTASTPRLSTRPTTGRIAAGRLVGNLVLQPPPGREDDEFRVGGAAPFLQVTGSQGKGAQAVPSPAHGNPLSAADQAMPCARGVDLSAALNCDRARWVPSKPGMTSLAPHL